MITKGAYITSMWVSRHSLFKYFNGLDMFIVAVLDFESFFVHVKFFSVFLESEPHRAKFKFNLIRFTAVVVV